MLGGIFLNSRGVPAIGSDGMPQTYFIANQQQRGNFYGNVVPGLAGQAEKSVGGGGWRIALHAVVGGGVKRYFAKNCQTGGSSTNANTTSHEQEV